MADEEAVVETPSKKKLPLVGALVLLVILGAEGVAVIGGMNLLKPPVPADASADLMLDDQAEGDRLSEVLIMEERLQNRSTGVTHVYDVEIFVQVREADLDRVTEEIERFGNDIKAEIYAIWKSADARHLQEARLETISRRIEAAMNARFGEPADAEEPIIAKCVIVTGTGFRADG